MNRKILIELFEEHSCVNYYTIRHGENEESETDMFFDKYEESEEFEKDFDLIVGWLDAIGEKGAFHPYFRPEGGRTKALPIDASDLRLYCYKISDCILILGNGGQKTTRTYQEDPLLNQYVEDLKKVGKIIESIIRKGGKINTYNCLLYGDLTIYIK